MAAVLLHLQSKTILVYLALLVWAEDLLSLKVPDVTPESILFQILVEIASI